MLCDMEPTDPDRPRGMLTSADREYLQADNSDISSKSEAQKRYRIRQRVTNGLLDFSLLVNRLPERDREQIFDPDATDAERDYFMEALHDVLIFLYLGKDGGVRGFESMVRFALEDALAHEGTIVKSVDVDIDFEEGISLEEAHELKRRRGIQGLLESVSRGEVSMLWEAGIITDKEYEAYRE